MVNNWVVMTARIRFSSTVVDKCSYRQSQPFLIFIGRRQWHVTLMRSLVSQRPNYYRLWAPWAQRGKKRKLNAKSAFCAVDAELSKLNFIGICTENRHCQHKKKQPKKKKTHTHTFGGHGLLKYLPKRHIFKRSSMTTIALFNVRSCNNLTCFNIYIRVNHQWMPNTMNPWLKV